MKLPDDIQFAPAGKTLLWTGNGVSSCHFCNVTETWVISFNDWLTRLEKAAADGLPTRPFADFEHRSVGMTEPKQIAFWPTSFFWGGWGPNGGVRVQCRWNPDFQEDILMGVLFGIYRAFSPCIVRGESTGYPVITSNIGGITQSPAFEKIEPITLIQA